MKKIYFQLKKKKLKLEEFKTILKKKKAGWRGE